ncbi:MAG: hypothetical protein HRU22_05160 [Gammaproteobacteria bacterium]|nr:hypothetical protein [Gammaproteobacteria bacterium]
MNSSYSMVNHRSQQNRLRYDNELTLDLNPDLSFTGLLRLEYNIDNLLVSHDHQRQNYSDWSKPHYVNDKLSLDLREFYLQWYLEQHYFKIGKQQVAWGESDGLRVLDVINPFDYSEFILQDFDDSRIPIWMINYSSSFDALTLQLLYIPDATTSFIPDGLYQPTTPQLTPTLIGDYHNIDIKPELGIKNRLKNADYAMRLSTTVDGKDISLVYINQYNDSYIYQSRLQDNNTLQLQAKYYRTNIFGLSYSQELGNVVLRSELSVVDQQYFHTLNSQITDGIAKRSVFNYVLAFDWAAINEGMISGQLFQNIISGSAILLQRDKVDSTWSLMFDKFFENQIYHLNLLYMQSINNKDGLIRIKTDWNINDELVMSLGANYFFGNHNGIFGQYNNNDHINLSIKYTY